MNNEELKETTWKDWVDWFPTYLILGYALSALIDKTEVIPTLWDKLKKDKTE